MAVGIKVGCITTEVGHADFFHAFFSTISVRLENGVWGSRFPALLKGLYYSNFESSLAEAALLELETVKIELSKLKPNQVVWDIEDLTKSPPWEDQISPEITSLANYFVTSTGRDLISVMQESIQELKDSGGRLEIVSY